MTRAPRSETFDEHEIGIYHCVNRCVRRAFLFGQDRFSGRSFDHRRQWIQQRLEELAAIFAIDHLNFSIMGNHLHVLVRNRPDVRDRWSNEEVAQRWCRLFPQSCGKKDSSRELAAEELRRLLADPGWVPERRRRLGHISWFMRCLAEDIAVQANREDETSGRFWQGRFRSQRILDECALLACAMYIDLNPIRARLAETPETSCFTSVYERILSLSEESRPGGDGPQASQGPDAKDPGESGRADWLSPVELDEAYERSAKSPVRRASHRGYLAMSFAEYLRLLDWTRRQIRSDKRGSIPEDLAPIFERLRINSEVWVQAVANFSRWFRSAVGRVENLAREAVRRGRKFLQGSTHCSAVFV